jgi:hypothetical protein
MLPLAPHVRACRSHGCYVFLDLVSNRYFALSRGESEHLSELLASPLPSAPPGWLSALYAKGLFITSAQTPTCMDTSLIIAEPMHCIAAGSLSSNSCDARIALRAAFACAWARRMLRHCSLQDLALRVATWHRDNTPSDCELQDLVCHFRRVRPWLFAARNRCLLHSLALLHFLAQFHHRATWVFGVNTQPWGAHSWVQTDAFILDDTPEHVRPYAPILVI